MCCDTPGQKLEPGACHVLSVLLPQAAANEPANSAQQQDDQGDDRQTKWFSHRNQDGVTCAEQERYHPPPSE